MDKLTKFLLLLTPHELDAFRVRSTARRHALSRGIHSAGYGVVVLFGVLAVCLAMSLAGCGGGNSGTGSNGAAANATGRATFTVKWTQRSRLLPEAANSIRVEVKNGASTVASSLLSRPAQGGTSSATFSALPVGNLTITATAYPQSDGTGTAQATATIPLVIAAGQDTPFFSDDGKHH